MKVVIHGILPAVSLLAAASFLPASCNKPSSQVVSEKVSPATNTSQSLRESATSYFTGLATPKADSVAAAPKGNKKYLQIINRNPVNKFAPISKTINWQDAFEEQIAGSAYLFVPVSEDIKPFPDKSYEFFRYLIFSKDNQARPTVSVIEVLSDKDAAFSLPVRQIAVTAYRNKMESKTDAIGSENASVMFSDNSYKQTDVFKLSNGAWGKGSTKFPSDLRIHN